VKIRAGFAYIAPLSVWMGGMFLSPIVIIFSFSFLRRGLYGGVTNQLTIDAYQQLWNPIYAKVLLNTLVMSIIATVIMIFFAIPTAYFMARSKRKTFWLFLVIIPFWTNFLIRIYAWIAILGNNGMVNQLLLRLGWIDQPLRLLYNPVSVILVLVYTYLPFAILPLFSTIEKFDFSLLEAARDLGATRIQAFRKVLIPSVKSGLFSAILFCFIPSFGQYAVPQLVGDSRAYMMGNIIARELTITRNWPLSAAISTLITAVTLFALLFFVNQNNRAHK